MVAVTEGEVVELVGKGFRLARAGAPTVLARTRIPGRRLRLQLGDRVVVYGVLDGAELWCEGVYRSERDGARTEVEIGRDD